MAETMPQEAGQQNRKPAPTPGNKPPKNKEAKSKAAAANKQPGELARFYKRYPAKAGAAHNATWSWVTAGDSATATLLLPPSPGFAALLHELIDALAPLQRVIAPTYPAVTDSNHIVDSLAHICRTEGVKRLNVVGIGFGGVLAQLFAKRGAKYVNKMILVNSSTPEAWPAPGDVTRYNASRKAPAWLLRRLIAQRLVRRAAPLTEDRNRWNKLIRECLAERRNKWEILALQAAAFHARQEAIDQGGWTLTGYEGRIQIIESKEDHRLTEAQRAALKATYPAAHVRKVPGAGYWLGCVEAPKLANLICAFLDSVNIVDRTPGQ